MAISGINCVGFYFKDTIAQSTTLTASSSGLTSGTLNLTLSSAAAAKLVLFRTLNGFDGVCVGPFTVASEDSNSNLSVLTNDTFIALRGMVPAPTTPIAAVR